MYENKTLFDISKMQSNQLHQLYLRLINTLQPYVLKLLFNHSGKIVADYIHFRIIRFKIRFFLSNFIYSTR